MLNCLYFQIKRDQTLYTNWKKIVSQSQIKESPAYLREILVKELLKSPKKYKVEGKRESF